jgi:hypothetical protein
VHAFLSFSVTRLELHISDHLRHVLFCTLHVVVVNALLSAITPLDNRIGQAGEFLLAPQCIDQLIISANKHRRLLVFTCFRHYLPHELFDQATLGLTVHLRLSELRNEQNILVNVNLVLGFGLSFYF